MASSQADPATVYYRDHFEIRFDDTTSGQTVRTVLSKYQTVIVGGHTAQRTYFVRIPDPGTRAAYDSLRLAVALEPGVDYVLPVVLHANPDSIRPDGRYPIDDPGQSGRAAWLAAPTNATRSRIAVRAMLAWGCETGDYGGTALDVGVADFLLDTTHADLATNFYRYHRVAAPEQLTQGPDLVGSTPQAKRDRHHGTRVAGNLTAAGDNGLGIAGMMWRSRLHFFAMSEAGLTPYEPAKFIVNLLDSARLAGIRVFNISFDILVVDTANLQPVSQAIARFVTSGTGALLVKSMGNASLQATSSVWAQGLVGQYSLIVGAIARLPDTSLARRRVLLVAGTDDANAFAGFSNFATGSSGTDLAAPAVNQLMLANTAVGDGSLATASGTSFAAPLVAGTGGLLWNMDPNLTPEQVRDYVLRGAREPRLNAQTGNFDSVATVAGAPQAVNLLDAYGAVTLLARERLLAPICGFPVSISDDLRAVILEPRGAASRTVSVPLGPNEYITSASVAQGGRRIATHAYDFVQDSRRSVVTTHTGALIHAVANTRRVYLERGTADITPGAPGDSVLRIIEPGDTTPRIFPLLAALDTTVPDPFVEGQFTIEGVEPSPDGNYAIVVLHWWFGCDPVQFFNQFVERERVFLFPLTSGTPQVLTQSVRSCPFLGVAPGEQYVTTEGGASWSHTGGVGVLFANGAVNNDVNAGWESRLTAFRPPSTTAASTVTIPGLVFDVAFESDDSLIVGVQAADFSHANCRRQQRLPEALATTVGSPVSLTDPQCTPRFLHIPNAPRRARRGFALFGDSGLRAAQRAILNRRVRVN